SERLIKSASSRPALSRMRVPSRNFKTITSALALAGLMTVLAGFGRTTLCFNAAGCPGCEGAWANIATALTNIGTVKRVDSATVTTFCWVLWEICGLNRHDRL